MKRQFLKHPWHLISITTGVQICEGNRVIVYIDEPNSKDHGPRRSQDVMERANLLLATPDLLAALKELVQMADPHTNMSDILLLDALSRARAAIAKAEGGE